MNLKGRKKEKAEQPAERERLQKQEPAAIISGENSRQAESAGNMEKAGGTGAGSSSVRRGLRGLPFILIAAIAAAVLLVAVQFPILRTYGKAMEPNISAGQIVLSVKKKELKAGDVVAFSYNNNILIKRVIALSGDRVDIDEQGTVSVNQKRISEPYVTYRSYGDVSIKFPYKVPEGKVFVLSDNRTVSSDSRNKAVGCVSSDQIVGKVIFRIWPLNKIGAVRS